MIREYKLNFKVLVKDHVRSSATVNNMTVSWRRHSGTGKIRIGQETSEHDGKWGDLFCPLGGFCHSY